MKPDYKNWMPKGMVYSFLFAFLGCGIAAAAYGAWKQPAVTEEEDEDDDR